MFKTLYRLFAVLLLTAFGVATWATWFWRPDEIILRNRTEAEWRMLTQVDAALERGPIPEAWDAGIFLATSAINRAFDLLRGTSSTYGDSEGDTTASQIRVELVRAKLETARGVPLLEAEMKASTRDVELRLECLAELTYDGQERDGNGFTTAWFRIVPLSVVPRLRLGWFDLRGRERLSDLAIASAVELLADDLRIPFRFRDTLELPLKPPGAERVPIKKGEEEIGAITLSASPLGPPLKAEYHLSVPVMGPGGVWLLGNLGQDAPPVAVPDLLPPAQLEAEVSRLVATLGPRLEQLSDQDADVVVWLHRELLTRPLQELASRPEAERTLKLQSTRVEGHLVKERWHDNLLGDGGYVGELTDDRAVSASVVLQPPSYEWLAPEGLKFSLDVSASAKADVKLHVDPLLGGGIGTSVGMEGGGSGRLSGRVSTQIREVAGTKLAVAAFELQCTSIPIKVLTDGKFVVEEAWIKVPQIGATIEQVVGEGPQKGSVLFSALAERVQLVTKDEGSRRVQYPAPALDVATVPVSQDYSASGLSLRANLVLSRAASAEWSESELAERERLRNEFSTIAFPSPVACPDPGGLRVQAGPVEFGPENEIVKILQTLAEAGKLAGAELERIGKEIGPEKVEEWARDPKKAFAKSDPGKAAKALEKVLNPFG